LQLLKGSPQWKLGKELKIRRRVKRGMRGGAARKGIHETAAEIEHLLAGVGAPIAG